VAGLLAGHAVFYWMAIDDSYIAFDTLEPPRQERPVYNPGQYVRAIPPLPGWYSSRP
jgi:hypothetical protein